MGHCGRWGSTLLGRGDISAIHGLLSVAFMVRLDLGRRPGASRAIVAKRWASALSICAVHEAPSAALLAQLFRQLSDRLQGFVRSPTGGRTEGSPTAHLARCSPSGRPRSPHRALGLSDIFACSLPAPPRLGQGGGRTHRALASLSAAASQRPDARAFAASVASLRVSAREASEEAAPSVAPQPTAPAAATALLLSLLTLTGQRAQPTRCVRSIARALL